MIRLQFPLVRKLIGAVFLLVVLFVITLIGLHSEWPEEIIWLIALLALLLVIVQYLLISRLDIALSQLRNFAAKAERNQLQESDFTVSFPDNELGAVAQHIIMLYKRLNETKEALFIEKEKLALQQEEKQQLKRQLTQNIAFELKTPVSSIQGYLDTILHNPEITREQLLHFAENSYVQSNRLHKLLNDISLLSRLDEPAGQFSRKVTDVSRIAAQVVTDHTTQIGEKRLVLHNELNRPLPVHGNEQLLYAIFSNLLENVLIHAGEGAEVWINCYQEDDQFYYFRFADSGTGVDSHHLGSIFNRFYRADKNLAPHSGTGLGLSIVKNAVFYHHGSIQTRNRKEGGLEVDFTLCNTIKEGNSKEKSCL